MVKTLTETSIYFIFSAYYADPKLGKMAVFFSSKATCIEEGQEYICWNPPRNLEVSVLGQLLECVQLLSAEEI